MARPLIQRILTRFDGSGITRARKEIRDYARSTGREVQSTQRDVEQSSGRVARSIRRAYQAVFVFITTQVVQALGRVSQQLFEAATAAEEIESQFRTTFGAATGEVQDFIDEFANVAGLTERTAREFTAQAGSIVQGMGASQEASAGLSEEIIRLAGDFQSFRDIPIEETFAAIRSAITAEYEPLKRLGVVLRQEEVNMRAMADTGKDTADALTQMELVQARLALITERAGVIIGDLERTADSTQNTFRRLRAEVGDMYDAFARNLLPTFDELITFGEQIIDNYQDAGEELGERFAGSIGQATTEVLYFVDASRMLVGTAQDAITALKQTEQGGLDLLQPLRWLREEIEGVEEGVGRSVEALLRFRTAWEEAVRPGSQRALDARSELEAFRQAREERRRSIEQAQEAREEARRLFELESNLNDLITDISQGNVEVADETVADMMESFEEAAKIGGEIGSIYEGLVQRLRLIQQARVSASPDGADPGGDDGPSEQVLRRAETALQKIQQAQQLRARFTQEERDALAEVFDAQEEIADLKKIQGELGEDAVSAELEAAQARLERARETLSEAEAFRDATLEAAQALNRMPLGRLGPEPGPDRSGRTFTVGEGEDERTFFGSGALRGLGFSEEDIERLQKAVEEYNDEAEEGEESTAELGEALQDVGRAVRSVSRLADVFGDLSDETRNALGGIADMVDGVGRLVELSDEAGGLGELLSSGSGIASAIVPGIGAASGVASVVASALQGNSEELRKHLDSLRENARALDRNTEAIFDQAQIGADVSEAELERGRSIEDQLTGDLGMSSAERQNLFADLAEIPGLEGIDEVAQDLWDTLSESPLFRGMDREQRREFINAILFGGADPEQIAEQFGVDLSDVIDDSFEPVGDRLDRISESLGRFGDSVESAFQFLDVFQQLGLSATEEMGAFIDFLMENVEGLPPAIQSSLDELAELDLSTQEGREQARSIFEEWVQMILSEEFDFGDLTPAEANRLIETFFGLVDDAERGGGGEDDVQRRTAQVARTITEFQANELLAYQREQVLLLRELVSAVAGQAALERVGATTVSTNPFPTSTFDAMEGHLAAIRATIASIAEGVPATPGTPPRGPSPRRPGGGHPSRPPGRQAGFRDVNITVNGAGDSPERVAQKVEDRVRRIRMK